LASAAGSASAVMPTANTERRIANLCMDVS
jgi:hypothetical protein